MILLAVDIDNLDFKQYINYSNNILYKDDKKDIILPSWLIEVVTKIFNRAYSQHALHHLKMVKQTKLTHKIKDSYLVKIRDLNKPGSKALSCAAIC
jgi:hypothetical protein